MRRIILALFLVVVLPGTAFPLHLEGSLDIGTGGGYDDNLNHASSHRQAEGAAFATSWIMVNASKNIGGNGRYFVGAGYEGIYYPSFTDLTVNGFTVRGGLSYSVSKKIIVNGRASLGVRTYGDRDRDATVYGVSLGMKNQVYQKFAVRVGYQYTKNAAEEDVFRYDANRFSVSGEMNVSKTAYLALGYALELSESTFYQPAIPPIPPGARPSTTFGANQVVLKADSLAHIFSVDWEQDIYDGIYGLLGYAHSYIQRDPEDYQDNFVTGKVGYRF